MKRLRFPKKIHLIFNLKKLGSIFTFKKINRYRVCRYMNYGHQVMYRLEKRYLILPFLWFSSEAIYVEKGTWGFGTHNVWFNRDKELLHLLCDHLNNNPKEVYDNNSDTIYFKLFVYDKGRPNVGGMWYPMNDYGSLSFNELEAIHNKIEAEIKSKIVFNG